MFSTEEIHLLIQDCFNVEVSYIGQNDDYWFFVTRNAQMRVSKEDCDTYYRVCTDDNWKYDFNLLK